MVLKAQREQIHEMRAHQGTNIRVIGHFTVTHHEAEIVPKQSAYSLLCVVRARAEALGLPNAGTQRRNRDLQYPGGHPNSPTDGHLKLPHLS